MKRVLTLLLFVLLPVAPATAQWFGAPEHTFDRVTVGQPSTVANEQCRSMRTTDIPFALESTKTRVGGAVRNFEDLKRENGSVIGIVPRNSIVKINTQPSFFARLNPWSMVDVTVLNVPGSQTATARNAARSPSEVGAAITGRVGAAVPPNTRGFMAWSNLRPAGDCESPSYNCNQTFIVERDSPIMNVGSKTINLSGRAVRFDKNSGGYLVNRCCVNSSDSSWSTFLWSLPGKVGETITSSKPANCRDDYVYEVLKDDMRTVQARFALNGQCDAFVGSLRPIPDNQVGAFANLVKMTQSPMESLEVIDSRGLVKIPTTGSGDVRQGPFGSVHYTPEMAADTPYDTFINPASACAFMRALQTHQQQCRGSGCQIQWGNAFHEPAWGQHRSHGKTTCIDIRPLRKSNTVGGLTYQQADYDREKTRAFLAILGRAGAESGQFFFNDPGVRGTGGVNPLRGDGGVHDNHIHVCFPPNSSTVQQTCDNGVR